MLHTLNISDSIELNDMSLSTPWLGVMGADLYPGGAVYTIEMYTMYLITTPVTYITSPPIVGGIEDEIIYAGMDN
jgi:hypothetical protein